MRIADKPAKGSTLTPREIECLRIAAGGFSNIEIAAAMGIHSDTVKFHLNSVSTKLGTSNRTGAVITALRRGLFQLQGIEVKGLTCQKCGEVLRVIES